ncbi:hypothetical protein VCHC51A1_3006 [Vibrio cholerae HC-51A1]|nr:hypothetical protein VCHE48_0985 [Vibrio cholerae HE48]EGS59041.1 hypothetical protein VCHC02A1_3086 [Vibrio cholerae HC-02A1]EJH52667.1 hypothetical protein VCHC43B1_2240 [Vibrio cholerae HC-43B1]EJH60573.1 hypothetical protein VCHE45_2662 [Vibrio cholerae HE-45]EKG47463.1 hypothetical protein VCHC50A1_3122 [Vibrio cholerae HC-50A1]EKG58314.1 hypothetical protein VCHC55A1_3120 [Vibrio cholerae HC-55A1]EKG58368.1 hypothetical protein VCHC56A1_3185 [Vibrio cholerae HC-56A1]EKG65756.1 hypot
MNAKQRFINGTWAFSVAFSVESVIYGYFEAEFCEKFLKWRDLKSIM